MLKEDLFRMRDAIDQYYADKNKWPSRLDDLVSDGYIREVPIDPITKSKDTWQAVNAEPNVNDATAEPRHLRREERIGRRPRWTAPATPTGTDDAGSKPTGFERAAR